MRRPPINLTAAERVARIVAGLAGVVAGAILLASVGSALAAVLEVALVLVGLDLMVTGALGFCPLYKRLGYVPPSLRRLA